ncbi:hypothetical protein CDAR_34911 [Caerostris darwini]|uniref:Uncharacterized protein n=1 Tax=Caerostris darwini TaxID=1538125 RepID=A0AAV4MTI9_9ARAC|nr:hypothetical protein CDAR_34911 [Caerostris darwini]
MKIALIIQMLPSRDIALQIGWMYVLRRETKSLINCTTNTTYFGVAPPFITTKTPHCSQRLVSCGGLFCTPLFAHPPKGHAFLEHNGWSNVCNRLCYLYWL